MTTPIVSAEDIINYPALIATLGSQKRDLDLQVRSLLVALSKIEYMTVTSAPTREVLDVIQDARQFILEGVEFRARIAESDNALKAMYDESEERRS